MRVLGLTIRGAFSGADNALFSALSKRGMLAGVVESSLPRSTDLALLVRTFAPSKRRWGTAWRNAQIKSAAAWSARTRMNRRLLNRWDGCYDVVLQVSGLFAPSDRPLDRPLALFCDYTTRLAERNYPRWFGLAPSEAPTWYARERELYRSAGALFTASENTRKSLVNDYGVAPSHVHVVGEGVHQVRVVPKDHRRAPAILFIGIDFERKGGDTLLEAFATVRRRLPHAMLHIVGPAPRDALDGVVWHGHISDRTALNTLFESATVLTLPSVCEPFGLALIEGMAHGLPVIGTTVDAMPEIITDGVTGYLVPPNDASALADRLTALLSDPTLSRAMGERGAAVVAERFLWHQVTDRVIGHLTQLVDHRPLSAR